MKFPNIFRAFTALARAMWWKIRRRPVLVPSEVQEQRIALCEKCEWFDAEVRQCLECTCFSDAKTWIASEECRRGKWKQFLKV